eukprot:1625963-Amphidinium_carterae.1
MSEEQEEGYDISSILDVPPLFDLSVPEAPAARKRGRPKKAPQLEAAQVALVPQASQPPVRAAELCLVLPHASSSSLQSIVDSGRHGVTALVGCSKALDQCGDYALVQGGVSLDDVVQDLCKRYLGAEYHLASGEVVGSFMEQDKRTVKRRLHRMAAACWVQH